MRAVTFLALLLLSSTAAAQQITLPARGSRTVELWVLKATQTVTLVKRDLNIYAGADILSYELKDAAGEVVQSGALPDDGITAKGGGAGKLQSVTLKPGAEGYHTLRLTSPQSDCIYDISSTVPSGTRVQFKGGSLTLNDYNKGGNLYLLGPTGGGSITMGTWHAGGVGQTINLLGKGTLSQVNITKTHTDYTLTIPASAAGQVLTLNIPKMDVYLSSKQVAGYALSTHWIIPAGILDGIYPLGVNRAVAPGGSSDFQLRLKNSGTTARKYLLTLSPGSGGFSLALVPKKPATVTVAPGQEKLVQIRLSCAAGTKVGAKATLPVHMAQTGAWPHRIKVHATAAAPAVVKRARPFLFYSKADIAAANKRAADPMQAWAKTGRDALLKSADAWLTLPVDMPTGEGAWSGFYVCASGPSLTYDSTKPKAHLCKVEGKVYTGEPYDGCWRTRRYGELARAARTLGLAWRLTGKSAYAKRAASILLGFSRVYLSHKIHDNRWGSAAQTATPSKSAGRLLSQTLSESSWLIPVLAAYDAVATSGQLSQAQRADIEHNLLRPAVALIQSNDAGKSNWQAWHNAAIGAAGYCLGEPAWVTAALSGKSGFAYHMKASMLSDGFWYEGSIGYHLYTLSAYRWLALAARHTGQDLYKAGLLKMVRAPLLMALPDLSFPKLNDGGTGGVWSMHGALEAAAAFSTDKDVRAVLHTLYTVQKRSRSSEEALLLGANLGATSSGYTLTPYNYTATGYAVLRGGDGATSTYVGLDYGPHGSWHGHFDKLQLLLYGAGALQLPDMGTTAYRLPYHAGFFKQTLSHNTVMLD